MRYIPQIYLLLKISPTNMLVKAAVFVTLSNSHLTSFPSFCCPSSPLLIELLEWCLKNIKPIMLLLLKIIQWLPVSLGLNLKVINRPYTTLRVSVLPTLLRSFHVLCSSHCRHLLLPSVCPISSGPFINFSSGNAVGDDSTKITVRIR